MVDWKVEQHNRHNLCHKAQTRCLKVAQSHRKHPTPATWQPPSAARAIPKPLQQLCPNRVSYPLLCTDRKRNKKRLMPVPTWRPKPLLKTKHAKHAVSPGIAFKIFKHCGEILHSAHLRSPTDEESKIERVKNLGIWNLSKKYLCGKSSSQRVLKVLVKFHSLAQ